MITQEDEREHEATAGECDNFSHAKHLAATRLEKLAHAQFITSPIEVRFAFLRSSPHLAFFPRCVDFSDVLR